MEYILLCALCLTINFFSSNASYTVFFINEHLQDANTPDTDNRLIRIQVCNHGSFPELLSLPVNSVQHSHTAMNIELQFEKYSKTPWFLYLDIKKLQEFKKNNTKMFIKHNNEKNSYFFDTYSFEQTMDAGISHAQKLFGLATFAYGVGSVGLYLLCTKYNLLQAFAKTVHVF